MQSAPVAVIIPLYNKQSGISRAIHSILAQTFQAFEIIVVNDGSTDGSLEVVQGINDNRLRIISQLNQGPGAARNTGIRAAGSAAFIAFLDADDEWLPDFLQKSLDILAESPDCGFTISAFYDGAHRLNSQARLNARGYLPGKYVVGSETKPNSFDWLLYAYLPSTAVFRRDVFQTCGGFYEKNKCKFGEDMYLFVTASLRYPFWRLGDPLVWYHSEESELAIQQNILTPLLTDPQHVFDCCPGPNKPVLQGLLADRAIQEALRQAYQGNFTHCNDLFERYSCLSIAGQRARNAHRQILVLRRLPPFFRRSAAGLVHRILHRLFPLSTA